MTGAASLFEAPPDPRAELVREGMRAARAELRPPPDESPESFRAYIRRHNRTLLDFEHIPRLASVAERIVASELLRVIICMPPRYLKSEVFSRLLPGYYLRRFASRHVGLASYGAQLAWALSEEARENFRADGGKLSQSTKGKRHWRTDAGGSMWAAGVGGPLLGFGYHLGIIDDPTDPEKAHSPTFQKRFEKWVPGKFMSRQEPDAAIVLIMQRLGIGDPIDFLFRREVGEDTDPAPQHWHVVICDEIRSGERLGRWDGPMGLPSTCTLEPDPRELGEVLAPSRFSRSQVEQLQMSAGTYVAAAQRQQRPQTPQGTFWRRDWFEVYDVLPEDAYDGGWDWDLAYTKEEANSASAGIRTFRGPGPKDQFPIYVEDVDWEWWEFPQLIPWIAGKGGPHYVEAKASGKSAVQVLKREKIAAKEVQVGGDKFARAAGVQPVVANGRIKIHRRARRRLLEGERLGLLRVTAEQLVAGGPDLDANDAFVQAIARHCGPRRRVGVYFPGMPNGGGNGNANGKAEVAR